MRQAISNRIANSSNCLKPNSFQDVAKGKKVYFGTGLASAKEVSCGFGFELLNMILTALILKERSDADGVLHEIGTVGYDISEKQRCKLIEEQLKLMTNMTRNLGIENIYNVVLSHSYQCCDFYKCILQDVETKMRPFHDLSNFQRYGKYIVFQIAQMKYLYEIEKTKIKLGWIIGNKPVLEKVDSSYVGILINKGHLNEYYFDSIYRYVFPNDEYFFVYTSAGMDVINGKKYSPYTVTTSQHRPLLTEPIKAYLAKIPNSKHKSRTLKLYEKTIVDTWEYLYGKIKSSDYMSDDESFICKLQYIQDKVLGISRV
ncbi:MAG: hypothetical protein FWE27_07840 [Defluviitaleaceae bacterium]|nr:hypothetical protein [Defluviitaleaceae bacterium]